MVYFLIFFSYFLIFTFSLDSFFFFCLFVSFSLFAVVYLMFYFPVLAILADTSRSQEKKPQSQLEVKNNPTLYRVITEGAKVDATRNGTYADSGLEGKTQVLEAGKKILTTDNAIEFKA